jgi:uncharacterized spore protein YtfJ
MDVRDILASSQRAMSAGMVFGPPFSKDGVTVIPAARVWGGAGGGHQQKGRSVPGANGGGFGVKAKPAGAYVLRGQKVQWMPAVDPNQIVVGFQILAVMVFLAVRRRRRLQGRVGGPRPRGRMVVEPAAVGEPAPGEQRHEASALANGVPVP